jgi:hypothetical protein
MAKFTFICEDEPMPFSEGIVTKRTIEFDAVRIQDVISEFELFLRGAGFNPTGTLDFIPDEEYYGTGPEWQTEEFATPQEDITEWDKVHSNYYFDTERNK